jgi:hypothetical protein
MECIRLAMIMGESCKGYQLLLVLVVTATVTTGVIRHPAPGAAQAVMVIFPEAAAMEHHRTAMAVVAIMDPRLFMAAAAAAAAAAATTDRCTPPTAVDPDCSRTVVSWRHSRLDFRAESSRNYESRPNINTDPTEIQQIFQGRPYERFSPNLSCIAMRGCSALLSEALAFDSVGLLGR